MASLVEYGINAAMFGMFDPASPQANAIAELFIVVLFVCAAIFVVVTGIITYAILRSLREEARGEQPTTPVIETESRWLEITWTVIPLMLVTGIFVLSVRAMNHADPAPEGAPDIVVRGHQWWWEIVYPEAGISTANELHLPVGRHLHLQIESADVVHDFWVPSLSRKIDMVPGRPNHLSFRVDELGRYEGACAEFCGTQHAWMRLDVVVHSQDEYERWLANQSAPSQAPATPAADAGMQVYLRETCDRCHSLRGAPSTSPPVDIGPDLTHLTSRRLLGAGVIPNDRANLLSWLKDPQAIKPGCYMPNFQLSDTDAEHLAAYLSELP